jgi:hypothetical protein
MYSIRDFARGEDGFHLVAGIVWIFVAVMNTINLVNYW